jgi:hypothetical protein
MMVQVTTSRPGQSGRLVALCLVSGFVIVLLVSFGAAMVSALPVWSAYCLPKGDGALDLVPGLSSRDVVSEDVACIWPSATVVWRSPNGGTETVTRSAGWRFATPLVVLATGVGILLWRRRRATPPHPGAAGTGSDLIDTGALPRVTSG